MDDTKGLRNQVKRHQAAAARGNGKSLTEGLPEGHGASLQASKDAQARIAERAAHRRTNPDLTPPAGADSELLDALEPGMDHSAVHRSTSGSWAVDNGDGSWSVFNKQGHLHTDSGSKRQLPADAWPTVHGKQQPAHESAASQKAKNEARLQADHYVEMHGVDGARKKLAQLQARKVKSSATQHLIAALQAKVGNRPGKA